jgi:hypothetical protein
MNEMPPIDATPDEARPVDPDREWTAWALGTLRELVDIDMRTARRIESQHVVAGTRFEPPNIDFALAQARIARAVRLTIAMTERIREAWRIRKAETAERRQRRRAQVAHAVTEALGPERPAADAKGAVGTGSLREALTETEALEVELDTLPIGEIVARICRRHGREPGRVPPGWEDIAAADEAVEPLDDPTPDEPEPIGPADRDEAEPPTPPARKPPDSS